MKFSLRSKFKKIGNLLVPINFKLEKQSKVSDYMRYWRSYLAYSNIYGRVMPLNRLIKNVRTLNRKEALILLSKINIFVTSMGTDNLILQNFLRESLFNKQVEQQIVIKQLVTKCKILFFERQILNLIKYVLLECDDKIKTDFDDIREREKLGLCLLGISDHLDKEETNKISVSNKEIQKTLLVKSILKGLFEGQKEQLCYMLVRYYLIWVKLTDEVTGLELDIKNKFKEITQLEIDSYIYLGLCILVQWLFLRPDNFSQKRTGINIQTYFKDSLVPKVNCEKMFNLLMLKIDDFQHQYKKELKITENPTYSFVTFKQRPLLALGDNFIICLSPRFLEEKITSGIYWIIVDGLKNEEEREKFLRDFGKLFERYIVQTSERIFGNRFLNKIFYGPNETEASDGLIFYPEELVFIEAKSSRFRLKTTTTGEIKEYVKDLEKFFIKGAEQLHNRIKDWKEGKIKSDKIKSFLNLKIKKFYPILIVPEAFPQLSLLWDLLNEKLKEKKLLQDHDIARLQVIDVEELEIIEPIIEEKGFLSLLKTKLEDKVTIDESMKNFIHRIYGDKQPVNLELLKRFREIKNEATQYVLGKRPDD